jgi:hypothetical protein
MRFRAGRENPGLKSLRENSALSPRIREGREAHRRSLGFARDDKGMAGASIQIRCADDAPQIPPLRNAPVGTTILFGNARCCLQDELSSRPERTRISCHAALDRAACAPFRTEVRLSLC